jgi:SAM-dependent methyltransferase
MPELDRVRHASERRVTRALRALRRRTRTLAGAAPATDRPERYDSWLELASGPRLREIDAECAGGGAECFAQFRDLDVDVWALLLTQRYDGFANIRALLPDVPDDSLQRLWNGASGAQLAAQSAAFYARLRDRFERHGSVPLASARVLDFGCGWGRLTRFLARDVESGGLYGCDTVEQILDVCRACRVPATFALTEPMPQRLPFDEQFDLAFAFSVFTHLSEEAHERCLRAIHEALRPGGLLIVTVRPPAYVHICEPLRQLPATLGSEPRYLFVPHAAEPSHFQYLGGEMTYGETVVTLGYVQERWAPLFELLAVDLLVADLYQVVLTLRRT